MPRQPASRHEPPAMQVAFTSACRDARSLAARASRPLTEHLVGARRLSDDRNWMLDDGVIASWTMYKEMPGTGLSNRFPVSINR